MADDKNDLLQLKQARGIIASVYHTQATDNKPDNGNLTQMNNAILNLTKAIEHLQAVKDSEE